MEPGDWACTAWESGNRAYAQHVNETTSHCPICTPAQHVHASLEAVGQDHLYQPDCLHIT